MNGVRRFLTGGLAGSNSQSDSSSPPSPITPTVVSGKPSWPPSTPPPQNTTPIIAQELSESPTPSPKTTTAALFLRRDKPRPPPPPQDDDLTNSSFQSSSRPSSSATSLTSSPSRAQPSPNSSRVAPYRSARKSVIDNGDTHRVSGLLNTRDELLMSLLASEAVVDSRGFEILSSEQVEDLKKEHQVLSSRLVAMTKKLSLETKIRDAALSLAKVNSPYKSVSKQSSEQLETANRKVEVAQRELWKISERTNEIYRKLLEHRAGVLSFSVRTMEKKQANGLDTPNFDLPSGAATPISRNGSSASPITSPSRKFEHFFAGHADSVVPRVPKQPLSIADISVIDEKLQAATMDLTESNKKQAEMARELSLLKLEKDEAQSSMEIELHNAEETINALEQEISKLEDLDVQVKAYHGERLMWEQDRAELQERRKEVETLERRLEVLEERSGEASEMERLLREKDDEIARIKGQWDQDRAKWENDKSVAEEDSSNSAAQLDESFDALRIIIQNHGIVLASRNAGSSVLGLVESIATHLDDTVDTRKQLEEARAEQEDSHKQIRSLEAQSREQSDRIAELVAQQSSISVPPVEYTGDAGTMAAALMPIWTVLPSAEARGAKLGQSRFRSPSSNPGSGGPLKPSLSEMDVRSLKSLYDASKSGQAQSPAATFTIEAFVARVQALINDDRALIERLLRFAQAHDLLKKNAERAQKLALDSNVALETYHKQVKTLENREITMSAKHAALMEEAQNLSDQLDRVEADRRDLEMQAAEQAEECRQLTDANNTLSAKTLALAEEGAAATDAVRRQMEAQLGECRAALQNAREEIEAMQNSEQTQRVALLEELNTMQNENSNLRAQLRNKK